MAKRPTRVHYRLSVVLEKDADGYFAYCPQLQGCSTQGSTYEEALANIQDAICLHIEDRKERGEALPSIESVSVATVDVAA
jgi:predicted RNase H-like HicB family nuclease